MAKDKKKRKAEGGFFGYVVDPIMKARVDLLMKTMPPNSNAAQLIHGLQAIGYQIAAIPTEVMITGSLSPEVRALLRKGPPDVSRGVHYVAEDAVRDTAGDARRPTMPPAGPPRRSAPTPDMPAPPIDAKRARPKHRPGAVKRKAKGKAGDTGFA